MKTIEKLLAEYKIRFRDTEKIKEDGYPFPIHQGVHIHDFNQGSMTVVVGDDVIINKNGKVYEGGIWATADLKEKPDKWVVERNEDHPMWGKFEKWFIEKSKGLHSYEVGFSKSRFYGNGYHIYSEFLYQVPNHQYLTLDQWAEFFLPKVDFSILNNEDWFYVKTKVGRKWVGKGNIIEGSENKGIHYCITSEILYRNTRQLVKNEDIELLRKATTEDLTPMFEKYPELAPPKAGDWGIFWDENPNLYVVAELESIGADSFLYPYETNLSAWRNFHKIDQNKPLIPQIDEFTRIYGNGGKK